MPDLEKVIKAWDCCCNPFNRKCKECPYEKDCYHDGISRHMVADAIALLKEQEAVKPMLITWDHPLKGVAYVCPNCKKEARDYWEYCPFCGKAIDWEGR